MPCPLCREEFTIPADGLTVMPKSFFTEKLLSARKRSAGEDAGQTEGGLVPCDVCSSEAASSAPPPATKRCPECQQYYCDQCSRCHTKIRATASHVLVPNLQNQVKSDREKITELLKKTGGVLPRIEKEKNDLVIRLGDVEGEINTAADKLIAAVERDRVKLLSEVESIRLERVRQLETVKQEVEQQLASLESLSQYAETLLSSGTAGDVTISANSLHSSAEELTTSDVIGHVDSALTSAIVSFTASTGAADANLVGTIAVEGDTVHPGTYATNNSDSNDNKLLYSRLVTSGCCSLAKKLENINCSCSQATYGMHKYDSPPKKAHLHRWIRAPNDRPTWFWGPKAVAAVDQVKCP